MTTIMERVDRTARIPPTHLRVDPPPPRSIKIEITGVCNLRCGFCALTKRPIQPTKPMEWGLLERLIRESREFGIEEIGAFYIGESFTATDELVATVRLGKEVGYKNRFLTSNATISTPERVRAAIEAGLTSLKWSVNNANAKQFAEVTQRPERLFYMALENIKAALAVRDEVFRRTGHWCELSASSIRYNAEQMRLMQPFLEKHVLPFVDHHYKLPPYTMGGPPIDQELQLGIIPTAGNQGRIGALVDPIPCWAVFNEAHVTSSGMLTACCFDADGSWTMADLKKVPLATGWHSDVFKTLRLAHLKGDVRGTVCERCALYVG
ncbi:radical SAM protein [Patescibacteria group bacterium]|nr:MAG: radical SAM protein [Patescibacteria group bacterium]